MRKNAVCRLVGGAVAIDEVGHLPTDVYMVLFVEPGPSLIFVLCANAECDHRIIPKARLHSPSLRPCVERAGCTTMLTYSAAAGSGRTDDLAELLTDLPTKTTVKTTRTRWVR